MRPPGEFDVATKKEGKDISYLDEKTESERERDRERDRSFSGKLLICRKQQQQK